MMYLLDANILITANRDYYPIDQVPEYWEWLIYNGKHNHLKIPAEIIEEITDGTKGDKLVDWVKKQRDCLELDEVVDRSLLKKVISTYAVDLTDDEIEGLRKDPFLIAYALADATDRCIVTNEVSKPSKIRQNRKIPDVCYDLKVSWCTPFELNRKLGFSTSWNSTIK